MSAVTASPRTFQPLSIILDGSIDWCGTSPRGLNTNWIRREWKQHTSAVKISIVERSGARRGAGGWCRRRGSDLPPFYHLFTTFLPPFYHHGVCSYSPPPLAPRFYSTKSPSSIHTFSFEVHTSKFGSHECEWITILLAVVKLAVISSAISSSKYKTCSFL